MLAIGMPCMKVVIRLLTFSPLATALLTTVISRLMFIQVSVTG